jgi:ERCC4-related helicase
MDAGFVSHPLLKENRIQSRFYQETILATAAEKNTLCVLPTGLGKTNIAILLAAHRLEKFPGSRILVLAPTKPLVNQHYSIFSGTMNLDPETIQPVTGTIKPQDRRKIYETGKIILATPQTIENDLTNRILSLRDFSLVVLDEAHHAVGNYAYPYIAKRYLAEGENQRILALTASPGGTKEKINEIYRNLGIETVEIRTEEDSDVASWVKEKEIEWIGVELPESFIKIKQLIDEVYEKKVETLRKLGFVSRGRVSKKDLLQTQIHLRKGINEGYKKAFLAASFVAQAIKLEHALTLLETQGIHVLESYWKKLRKDESKAAGRILNDKRITAAILLTHNLYEAGSKHPKIGKLCSIVSQQVRAKPDSMMIIFANFRDTVKEIADTLGRIDGVKPAILIGQKEGLSQKEQVDVIRRFESGEYNTLVTTSIGEEGLHLSTADIAIFYEPVPSEIRSIQRRGRVARIKLGKIIVLVTKHTRDEAYYWTAVAKERKMKRTLYDLRSPAGALTQENFKNSP